MEREAALGSGKPGAEDWITRSTRLLSWHIPATCNRPGDCRGAPWTWPSRAAQRERAALYESRSSTVGGLLRECARGTAERAMAALELSKDRDVEYGAAFALALAGDSSRSQTLANDLEKRFPEDTSVRFSYLPALRALLALNHGEPAKAIELLQIAVPYELGAPPCGSFRFFRNALSGLCAWRGLSGRAPGRRSRRGIPEDSRSPRDRCQRSHRRTGALATRQSASLCRETRPRQRPPTRISSPSGKTPTPTSRSSSKPRRNTPNLSNSAWWPCRADPHG